MYPNLKQNIANNNVSTPYSRHKRHCNQRTGYYLTHFSQAAHQWITNNRSAFVQAVPPTPLFRQPWTSMQRQPSPYRPGPAKTRR